MDSQDFSVWSVCFLPYLVWTLSGTAVSPIIKTHAHQVKYPVSALNKLRYRSGVLNCPLLPQDGLKAEYQFHNVTLLQVYSCGWVGQVTEVMSWIIYWYLNIHTDSWKPAHANGKYISIFTKWHYVLNQQNEFKVWIRCLYHPDNHARGALNATE